MKARFLLNSMYLILRLSNILFKGNPQVALVVKNLPADAGDEFHPWVRKIPWSRKWNPTSVFLPKKLHGQQSLVGYSPWGRKESDTTEGMSTFKDNVGSFSQAAKGVHRTKELTNSLLGV